MNSLTIWHEHGKGTGKDLEKPFICIKKAAENGNEVAMFKEGILNKLDEKRVNDLWNIAIDYRIAAKGRDMLNVDEIEKFSSE
ncbi:kinase-like domain-containing protein [Rhizophagus irregularis DAOM 181602=DAOM 197198]|uniref:Uncharacterized protein n=2 Tax=Rhizophagus irregularis TaxID=588596 RepID=A0A2I1EPW0_9GLOM|nr:hypothetical protein GLOIN_2v1786338 [Rhizophagus irregularis DAOM 181602=DAOM 197198]PKK67534.1 hypothetical protein RhiirC2_783392 [Rhizophagus irregularis]PKY24162.1 hypothetical protein RhiirB3_438621 [Rhizophagus irregularis]POG61639.1 hypothetical protein GLOIN_2v1786338 [Rhizophagus irregularis DAOM 181602=DAOM 197198]GET50747.1 kinase-like domain-containing protein [Rhizophagus irregularis DAOM 181602=DAOM 197198]|eukprot:XP_025168505.1 hypothetical protein GLOIN_2v1786338 [Rhizophagus irregularis DAOM 181602=DAOM 197198]